MIIISVGVGDVEEDGDDTDDEDSVSKLRTVRDRTIVFGAAVAPTGCTPIVKTKEELKFSSLMS
ncbi:hypothetical protein DY000_02015310 [Brassica cretica]|uniref:Uncharacterized protein n=1 Tax=Brassica cretica TaxID=69181 RepID=A0ABQ7D2R3_BRACR|nr:hypothetical protein DY000_02015310 [Brassica cretica]